MREGDHISTRLFYLQLLASRTLVLCYVSRLILWIVTLECLKNLSTQLSPDVFVNGRAGAKGTDFKCLVRANGAHSYVLITLSEN